MPRLPLSLGVFLALSSGCEPATDKGDDRGFRPGDLDDTAPAPDTADDTGPVPDDSGVASGPVLRITPSSADFGTVYIGCEPTAVFTIANVGNEDLVVSDADYVATSRELDFDDLGTLPWTLAPGASQDVTVTYAPLDAVTDDGVLTLTTNDPAQATALVTQTGTGELYGENLDTFVQPDVEAIDFLFVLDNSGSMVDYQADLVDSFDVFVDALTDAGIDYHIAVITTDDPTFRGDVLTPATTNIEDEFLTQASVAGDGSGVERPSEMAWQATQPGADAAPGGDFLRDYALFSMIFVSDEPDASPSNWTDYLSWFESLKAAPSSFVANAISGDWPGGCGGASATNNVYEMTVASGGLYLSICAADWGSHMTSLAEVSAGDLTSFELSAWPVPETVIVTVDGVVVTSGWIYNETNRSLDFDDPPAAGATIEVQYALFGDCEE